MHRTLILGLTSLILLPGSASHAGPREGLLAQYAATAKSADFSATRGHELHTTAFTGGKTQTPSCTSCHGNDVRGAGQTLSGKPIEAMALSVTPTRYTDAAKVEKWFKRNCIEVLGRECTAQEKGDWLSYMLSQ
jgi:mono/diheme cytochrome c family protein